jgi:shikimate dehydrogenase
MRKFGLIGYPLGHSFSGKYFTEKFQAEHISDCVYENYPLKNISDLKNILSNDPSLEGLNVTIPHKSDVLGYLDHLSDEAKEIGAVNVIKVRRNSGKILLSGFNSDVYGFTESLLPFLDDIRGEALVLGAGGSSKAVCYALKKIGMKTTIVSRKHKPGMIAYSDLDEGIMKNTRLIVNTTPLGMYPDIAGKPELDYDLLNNKHILYDLVYNPELTSFLSEGKERGCVVISGIKMLYLQAEKSWEIWNNAEI